MRASWLLIRGPLVITLSVAVLVSTVPSQAAPAVVKSTSAPDSAPVASTVQEATGQALAAAKSSGVAVPVASLSTQFEAVSANPDGASLTSDLTASPVRILVDGQWQGLDMSLESADGVVAPAVAGNSVALAPGGSSGPLVSVSLARDLLKQSAASFSGDDVDAEVGRSTDPGDPGIGIDWPSGAVPSPAVSGEDARYPGIASGVDAVVSATPEGVNLVETGWV